jgi:hypothetical protein
VDALDRPRQVHHHLAPHGRVEPLHRDPVEPHQRRDEGVVRLEAVRQAAVEDEVAQLVGIDARPSRRVVEERVELGKRSGRAVPAW